MNDDLRRRLLETFRVECAEHLEVIRDYLARQEGDGDLDDAYRRAHSLKGAARAVDLRGLESLAHRLESVFSRLRQEPAAEGARDLATRLLDALDDGSEAARQGRGDGGDPAVLAEADTWLAGGAPPAGDEAPEPPPPPPPQPREPQEPPAPPDPQEPAEAVVAAPSAQDSLRVPAASLDALMHTVGQLVGESRRQGRFGHRLAELAGRTAEIEAGWSRLRTDLAEGHGGNGADLAGLREHAAAGTDQARRLGRDLRLLRQEHARGAWSLAQLSGRLTEDVRRVRTVGANDVYMGLRRAVRRMAADIGKQVEFVAEGLDTRADRVVLQALYDPVVHLLRNAIDHGIEDPDTRRGAGKPPRGRVTLRLRAEGSRLHVEVADDGAGVDVERVAGLAVERGLLSAAERATATPDALARLLFHPGFSTAGQVTDLSGRGLGLSIVDDAARALQGSVVMRGEADGGTRFTIDVPLYLASERVLLVELGGQTFALPCHGIERLLRVDADDVDELDGSRLVRHGGRAVPCADLGALLDLPADAEEPDRLRLVVLRRGDERLAVAVDTLRAVRETLVEDLGDPLARGFAATGGFFLEDGSIALVLDPSALFERSRQTGARRRRTARQARATEAATILVVDDSITTRTLEKSILEAHGFRVRLAVDGIEALEALRAAPADLVVSDIEMPRLDGFGLLERLQADADLRAIPVILVSSLAADEDRRRGLDLGAAAYVVKQKFDQRDLLETIEQLL